MCYSFQVSNSSGPCCVLKQFCLQFLIFRLRGYQSIPVLYVGASKDMGKALSTSSSCTN